MDSRDYPEELSKCLLLFLCYFCMLKGLTRGNTVKIEITNMRSITKDKTPSVIDLPVITIR
jgi:hypothetical protein